MPFTNPIVGGTGVLIRDAIQSQNFVAGVSGWQITRSGHAEFNDVTIRTEFPGQRYVSNRYYDQRYIQGATTSTAAGAYSGAMFYVPMYIAAQTAFQTLTLGVTTAGSVGSTVTIGRYTTASNGDPDALVTTYGTLSVASTGSKIFTVNETLAVGWHYFGFISLTGGAGLQFTGINAALLLNLSGSTTAGGSIINTFQGGTGAMPAIASGTPIAATSQPAIVLRAT